MLEFLTPNWPAPSHVKAYTTTRQGGVSQGAYAGLNLATHVGDTLFAVAENRQHLGHALALPNPPCWLDQVHGTQVVSAGEGPLPTPQADACIAHRPQQVCAVMTADCLPLLVCDQAGTHIGAIHAGWRGLAAGIIEATLTRLRDTCQGEWFVWLGPAIGPTAFEVGEEVRQAFIATDPAASIAFIPGTRPGHWLADLYLLARQRLQNLGISHIFGGEFCTYTEKERFFSYRREGTTGRMASLIWLEV